MCVCVINYISLAGLGMQSINSYIEHINNRDILDKKIPKIAGYCMHTMQLYITCIRGRLVS